MTDPPSDDNLKVREREEKRREEKRREEKRREEKRREELSLLRLVCVLLLPSLSLLGNLHVSDRHFERDEAARGTHDQFHEDRYDQLLW
jgi:hypothetical protein